MRLFNANGGAEDKASMEQAEPDILSVVPLDEQ